MHSNKKSIHHLLVEPWTTHYLSKQTMHIVVVIVCLSYVVGGYNIDYRSHGKGTNRKNKLFECETCH